MKYITRMLESVGGIYRFAMDFATNRGPAMTLAGLSFLPLADACTSYQQRAEPQEPAVEMTEPQELLPEKVLVDTKEKKTVIEEIVIEMMEEVDVDLNGTVDSRKRISYVRCADGNVTKEICEDDTNGNGEVDKRMVINYFRNADGDVVKTTWEHDWEADGTIDMTTVKDVEHPYGYYTRIPVRR